MRIALAIGTFIAATMPLGFVGFCVFQAISELGVVLAVQEIVGGWENIAILGGCILFGAALLITGVSVLISRPESAHGSRPSN
jgi:hypothetical protein